MPEQGQLDLGGERVRIILGGEESSVIEHYEIRQSFFTQPGTWALRVGHSKLAADMLAKYPPGTDYTLLIELPDGRKVPQMTGRIDHQGAEPSSGATEITLRGRDWMMPLHDGYPDVERTFGRVTAADLVKKILVECGVPDYALTFSNDANRLLVQGVPKIETSTETVTREFAIEDGGLQLRVVSSGEQAGTPFASDVIDVPDKIVALPDVTREVTKIVGYDIQNPIKAKLGTSWLHLLQEQLNRAGLFLFAGVDEKNYILTQPQVDQAATWRITRRRGASFGILSCRHTNDTAHRFSEYVVRGRGGGGADGRKQIEGRYTDAEMVGWGLIKRRSWEDQLAKTSKAAEYLAKRHWAEASRSGWTLSYSLRGVSWPTLRAGGGSGARAVWAVDSMVEVVDEELGISGPFWISEVAMRGGGSEGTTTDITLHRPEHLIFADEVLPQRVSERRRRRAA